MSFDNVAKLRHQHIPHPTKYHCINRSGGKRTVRAQLGCEHFGGLERSGMLYALEERLPIIIYEELVLWQGAK